MNEERMSLDTIKKYKRLKSNVDEFLAGRLRTLYEARKQSYYSQDYLLDFEIREDELILKYSNFYGDTYWEEHKLPLDILFDDDFYVKILERIRGEIYGN